MRLREAARAKADDIRPMFREWCVEQIGTWRERAYRAIDLRAVIAAIDGREPFTVAAQYVRLAIIQTEHDPKAEFPFPREWKALHIAADGSVSCDEWSNVLSPKRPAHPAEPSSET